ncbi:MAG: hypothetical protein DMG84_18560, partial [Acidobacteria bacterium]
HPRGIFRSRYCQMDSGRISRIKAEIDQLFKQQVDFFRESACEAPTAAELREYEERRERIRDLFAELMGLRRAA